VVAICDDDSPKRQRRGYQLLKQLPPRGHEQVHLSLAVQLHAAVQNHFAQPLA